MGTSRRRDARRPRRDVKTGAIVSGVMDAVASAVTWLRSLWWNLARRNHVEASLDAEVREFVDLLTSDCERKGMSPADARRAALVRTRGVDQVKEATRDAWAGSTISTAQRELRYALRTLRRAPRFVTVAVITLALGIGGATAVFTVINGSLLRPLPGVAIPRELVTVERMQNMRMIDELSQPDYLDLRARTTTLSGIAGYNGGSFALGEPGAVNRVWVSFVTANFFTVLGVRPQLGRVFTERSQTADDGDVVVIGHDMWQREFHGSKSIIGSTLKLDGNTYTIIGVAAPKFIGAMATHGMDAWIPVTRIDGRPSAALGNFDLVSRRQSWMRVVGRLAPGKTTEDAQRDLAATMTILANTYPASNADRSIKVVAGSGMTPGERVDAERIPRLLAIAVALLLLIACANVASLSLIRAAARRRELATRLALGASRAALVRQVVLEGLLIALAAGALGIFLARLLVQSATLVPTVVSTDVMDLTMNGRVLTLAVAASALTAILVSLVPALQIGSVSASTVMKDGGGAVRRRGGQRALVSMQIGASFVLLYGTLLIHSAFQRVLAFHEATDPRALVTASINSHGNGVDTARVGLFRRELLARLSVEPDIAGVALTNTVPPFEWSGTAAVFRRGEEPPPSGMTVHALNGALRASTVVASNQFFDVMRIPIIRGRGFAVSDDEHSERVAIVSRSLASALWPGEDPLGRFIAWPAVEGPAREPVRVVGVAEDTRTVSTGAVSPPAMYMPFAQHPSYVHMVVARARGSVTTVDSTIRRVAASIDSRASIVGAKTLATRLGEEVAPQRTASAWIGVFGVIALLLAAMGLYGIVMQSVIQRTREIAVRCALGASPMTIVGAVFRDGAWMAVIGAGLGGVGSIVAYRVLRALFAGVSAIDVVPVAVALVVLSVALATATYLPARRAARLNPADALRAD
jgi:putative ABC transport system permease protein